MTVQAAKNGCFDRAPYKPTIDLMDHHGRMVTSFPFRMARDCQFTLTDLGQADNRCTGCKWRKEPAA